MLDDNKAVQHDSHTPTKRLTATCSFGLQHTCTVNIGRPCHGQLTPVKKGVFQKGIK